MEYKLELIYLKENEKSNILTKLDDEEINGSKIEINEKNDFIEIYSKILSKIVDKIEEDNCENDYELTFADNFAWDETSDVSEITLHSVIVDYREKFESEIKFVIEDYFKTKKENGI